jgi:PP-loop superfamily ATP-utilizing enzyme
MRAIGQVEHYLARQGIFPLRVRYIPDGVRVEAGATHFQAVLALKKRLLAFCRARGLRFVTLDLGGLQSGPWDKKIDVR